MIWAALSDVRKYILSNRLCLSVVLLYPIFITSLYINGTPPTLGYIAYSVGIALVIFSVLVALFAYGYIGGGDVKLIPGVALWAGPNLAINFLLITTLCGGLVAILIISFQYLKKYLTKEKSSENKKKKKRSKSSKENI